MPENKVTLEELRERIRRAPFHRWLGVEITALTEDEIEFRIPWREEIVVHPDLDYTHGGILATIIDFAADYAIAAKIGAPVPTIDLRVDYHRMAVKCDLTAKARVIKLGRTYSTAEAEIRDPEGTLLASGRGVYLTQQRNR